MKKQVLRTAILAALAANAHAVLPTIDPTTTTTLYISGASAQRGYIQQLITGTTGLAAAEKICDTTKPIYWFAGNSAGAADKNYDAWYCAKSTTNTALNGAKANILIHKRSAGGSDMGVAPIITPAPIGFLDISSGNCTEGTTAGGITPVLCGTGAFVNNLPDLGVSDVEPAQFVGKNVSAGFSAVTSADLAKLKIQSTSTVLFGEQVTSHLYNTLQAAQIATGVLPASCAGSHTEACLPSLSSAVIADIHAGKVFDWDQIQVGNTGQGLYTWATTNAVADQPAVSSVHVVRRVNGSGTQTQHGIVFLNYPCDLAASSVTTAQNDLAGQGEATTGYVIHEMSTSGNVNKALTALDKGLADNVLIAGTNASASTWAGGVRWAVGLNSLEQVTSATTNYEFVKVDGVAPTLANVVAGKYHDWVENTFQYNISGAHNVASDVAAVRDAIIAKSAHPAVLSGLNTSLTHVFGTGAYLAHPSTLATAVNGPSTVYVAANPVNVFTRAPAGSSTDNCRVPTVYNDGNHAPLFGL